MQQRVRRPEGVTTTVAFSMRNLPVEYLDRLRIAKVAIGGPLEEIVNRCILHGLPALEADALRAFTEREE